MPAARTSKVGFVMRWDFSFPRASVEKMVEPKALDPVLGGAGFLKCQL
jgi:hypothetical protein